MNIRLEDIQKDIERAVRIALEEDIGDGDITAMLIPEDKTDTAEIITREACVVCGQAWVDETFKQLGGLEDIHWHVKDGDFVAANTKLVTLKGNSRRLLTGERTALNFLQLLSGTASKAKEYKDALGDSEIKILDTRKTIPGLRTAQKYAVATGGCHNHRIGLYDAFLIKENHILACGGIAKAIRKARELAPKKTVEIEVENIEELKKALVANPDIIMLDEFSTSDTADAVRLTQQSDNTIKLEISGGISLEILAKISLNSANYISIGGLTKHCQSADLSMRIVC
ncbi:MAG: nicotinate-nucleotide pyrophosphorylase (carboxylating) [Lentisphaeria bacterium]|jgi:nicotinate-nucleotide pyrophosphorylase (carboxylating)